VAAIAGDLFRHAAFPLRQMQSLRPYICPFGLLVEREPRGARVLDVGCGSGLFLGLLLRAGAIAEGVGFDVDRGAVDAARAMAARAPNGTRLRFECLPPDAPWPEGPFDVVSMVDVMHHVPVAAQRDVVRKVAERLAPGGLFLYKDMVKRPRWRAWANRLHDLVVARQWIHYLDLEAVVDEGRRCGLHVTHRGRVDRWWYGHEYAVLEKRG
jgi:SAM-dependent methyltransferase